MSNNVEFTKEQEERIDFVENAVFDLCATLLGDDSLEWDINYIGEIADVVCDILANHGKYVRYPARVLDKDGNERIEEYYGRD